MTLKQVIKRIETICTSHRQVRNFYSGLVSDFVTDHTTLYPSVFCEDGAGTVTLRPSGMLVLNYKLYFLDLVNVSADSKTNEVEVQSDQLSVALDILTQINYGEYGDWKVSSENTLELKVEESTDMLAGVAVDITISTPFKQDVCAVPSDLEFDAISDTTGGMIANKNVYDLKYTGNGTEGNILTIAELQGKKILLITRGSGTVVFKVSNLPESNEYTWNDTDIEFGAEISSLEPILILYRNY